MPKIVINEVDLTTSGAAIELSNVVYVPGIAKAKLPNDFEEDTPRFYDNLDRFKADFGLTIPRIGLGELSSDKYPSFENGFGYDTGYIYATELLRLGIPVVYDCLAKKGQEQIDTETGEKYCEPDSDSYMLSVILERLESSLTPDADITKMTKYKLLTDKGLYNIKYLSNGGYVTPGIQAQLFNIAKERKDCVAILDIQYKDSILDFIKQGTQGITKESLTSNIIDKEYAKDEPDFDKYLKYASVFAPWSDFRCPSTIETAKAHKTDYKAEYPLPGSFAYFMALANAIKNGANNWAAVAGATRGAIPYLVEPREILTEAVVHVLQTREAIAVNPIATINPFGTIVWGNRTLFDNTENRDLTASSFLNIRNMCSDIKKELFKTARELTFEQNSDILWINFKSLLTPLLDKMVTGNALSGYELLKRANKKKAELRCVIRLYAIEAVEDFEIEVQLADESTAVIE